MTMEFQLLGSPLAVRGDGPVHVRAGKERALLADLLLEAGRVVPTHRLVRDLWAEPPPTAAKIIQVHVSHLRRCLPPGRLVTVAPGYRLDVADDELDLDRFTALVAAGRQALAAGDAAAGSDILSSALSLWRATPLEEFAEEPFARDATRRLEELRLTALEHRIEADLQCARHRALVPELGALVDEHPTHERFRAQLMLALYRSGRQADALAVYRDGARLLRETYGIAPSPMLRELELRILGHDELLGLEVRAPTGRRAAGGAERPPRAQAFVGRRRELGRIEAALAALADGEAPVIAIAGEPGIGKTRLAEEAASRAARAGLDVRWGRCSERDWAPAYLPWLELLGEGRAAGRSLEQLAGMDPARPAGHSTDAPRARRYRLFERVGETLCEAARRVPLCLVLDDLHVADESSLLLLDFLTRRTRGTPILFVLTFRDAEVPRGHPLSALLNALAREGAVDVLPLEGLSAADVHELLDAHRPAPPELAGAVHARTAGNALFVTELARLRNQGDDVAVSELLSSGGGPTGLPASLRRAILRRADRLSSRSRAAIVAASVLGREFDVETLRRLDGHEDGADLLDTIDEGLEARLLEEGSSPDRPRFAHTLIREALMGELSNARRAYLHARAAAILEERRHDADPPAAATIAHHLANATGFAPPGQFARWSLLAGEEALASHAPEEAIGHLRRALAASSERAGPPVADIRFALGRAKFALLQTSELDGDMREAFERYVRAGAVGPAVAVATFACPPFWELGGEPFAELLERARAIAPEGSAAEARVLASLGWFAGAVRNDHEEADRLLDRARMLARTNAGPEVEARALVLGADVAFVQMDLTGSVERARAALAVADGSGDASMRMQAQGMAARSVLTLGDLDAAYTLASEAFEQAQTERATWWLAFARRSLALHAALAGDDARAIELSDDGLAGFPRDPRLLALRATLGARAGRPGEVLPLIERLQRSASRHRAPGRLGEHAFLALGVAIVARHGIEMPLADARAAAARVLAAPSAPLVAMLATTAQAVLAVRDGDPAACATLVDPLGAVAGMNVPYTTLAGDLLVAELREGAAPLDG